MDRLFAFRGRADRPSLDQGPDRDLGDLMGPAASPASRRPLRPASRLNRLRSISSCPSTTRGANIGLDRRPRGARSQGPDRQARAGRLRLRRGQYHPRRSGAPAALPLLSLVKNTLGKGVLNAIRAGIAATTAEVVIITMADLSDDVSVVPRMVELVSRDWMTSSALHATCGAVARSVVPGSNA